VSQAREESQERPTLALPQASEERSWAATWARSWEQSTTFVQSQSARVMLSRSWEALARAEKARSKLSTERSGLFTSKNSPRRSQTV